MTTMEIPRHAAGRDRAAIPARLPFGTRRAPHRPGTDDPARSRRACADLRRGSSKLPHPARPHTGKSAPSRGRCLGARTNPRTRQGTAFVELSLARRHPGPRQDALRSGRDGGWRATASPFETHVAVALNPNPPAPALAAERLAAHTFSRGADAHPAHRPREDCARPSHMSRQNRGHSAANLSRPMHDASQAPL